MVLNSVSRKLRSLASRCTTDCKPSASRRPMRPRTLSRKLDLAGISVVSGPYGGKGVALPRLSTLNYHPICLYVNSLHIISAKMSHTQHTPNFLERKGLSLNHFFDRLLALSAFAPKLSHVCA